MLYWGKLQVVGRSILRLHLSCNLSEVRRRILVKGNNRFQGPDFVWRVSGGQCGYSSVRGGWGRSRLDQRGKRAVGTCPVSLTGQ